MNETGIDPSFLFLARKLRRPIPFRKRFDSIEGGSTLLMKTHAESGTSCNTDASRDDDDVDCFCSAVSIWPIFALNGCIVDLYSSSRAGNLL